MELSNEKYSELIDKFLDGEINDADQKQLFNSLSMDDELQSEFREAVEINKGFTSDKNLLSPSARLTKKVFQNAGVSLATAQGARAANAGSKLKNFAKPIVSAVGGALIASLAFLAIFNPFSDNIETQNAKEIATINIPDENFHAVRAKKAESVYRKQKSTISNETAIAAEESENVSLANSLSFLTEAGAANPITTPSGGGFEKTRMASFNSPAYFAYNNITEGNRFALETRGIAGLALSPSREIMSQPFSFNNLAFGARYKIDENHSFGVIGGKESLQMYSVERELGEYKFNLEPNLAWVGASYRYTFDELAFSVYPYAEVVAAGTKFGPMGKASAGVTYNPENFFSMSAGLEGSALFYNFIDKTKTTEKLSFVYSFGFHF